ncbi:phosphatase [Streptomyces sp. NPDC003737]|uniref:phosphatase n=1 Tax=Streptomyces sp. NPDC003737 TaxID=3364685 RepID=UPI003699CB75
MTAPSRASLSAHLVRSGIAGEVATPREINLRHYGKLAAGDRYHWFGLDLGNRWTDQDKVLALMAERCGVVADPAHVTGQDTIGPELTLAALDRMAAVLRKAADDRERVLLATGHPGALLDLYRTVAAALRAAGCEVVTVPSGLRADDGLVVQLCDVAMVDRDSTLFHTHSPEPMATVLEALRASGQELPGLVLADHGWAGGAAQHSVRTVGFADCNDPALFVAETEGTVSVAVPLDDHVADLRSYEPLTAYLLDAAGLF